MRRETFAQLVTGEGNVVGKKGTRCLLPQKFRRSYEGKKGGPGMNGGLCGNFLCSTRHLFLPVGPFGWRPRASAQASRQPMRGRGKKTKLSASAHSWQLSLGEERRKGRKMEGKVPGGNSTAGRRASGLCSIYGTGFAGNSVASVAHDFFAWMPKTVYDMKLPL